MNRLALFTALMCATAAFADFDGPYAPENWTLVTAGDAFGTLDATTMYIQGINSSWYSSDLETYQAIKVPWDDTLSFDWDFGTSAFPDGDWFYYEINGTKTIVTSTPGTGNLSIPVSANDDFALGIESADNLWGAGYVTITNFSYVPEPASLALIGTALLVFRRR